MMQTRPNLIKADLDLTLEGRPLKAQIYVNKNRYYINFNETIKLVKTFSPVEEKVYFEKGCFLINDELFVPLFALCKILNLVTSWDYANKSIELYQNRHLPSPKLKPSNGRPALLRLEDICPGQKYSTAESLARLRVIADYLYVENIPFHVAWVPRYIDPRPESRCDNDPSKHYSMYNADFVFTLDYLIAKQGIIGLHGYTHQYGSTVSISGTEFPFYADDGIPDSDDYVIDRINKAITTANILEIPCCFFEVPHYVMKADHYKILERYFNYIYTPHAQSGFNVVTIRSQNGLGEIKYIPAPLDYIPDKHHLPDMLNRIEWLSQTMPNALGSFFFHAYIDFAEITVNRDETGYPTYHYCDNSLLKILINQLRSKGYSFTKIIDLP